MPGVEVVRGARLRAGDATRGIIRETAFERGAITVSRSRIPGGVSSSWHHHAERHLFGFLVAGRLRLEYGPNGSFAVEVGEGDFFHIPPRLIHRDVNPSPGGDSVVVNILSGDGTTVVNVKGPDLE